MKTNRLTRSSLLKLFLLVFSILYTAHTEANAQTVHPSCTLDGRYIYYAGSRGTLCSHWNNGTKWVDVDYNVGILGSPSVSGDGAVTWFRGVDGNLHYRWINGTLGNTGIYMDGNPSAQATSQAVWFRGKNQTLCVFWSDGSVYHFGDFGIKILGDPSVTGDAQNVWFWGSDGKLQNIWSDGRQWNWGHTGIPIGGNPVAQATSQAVWFRGGNGHLCNFWTDGRSWFSSDTGIGVINDPSVTADGQAVWFRANDGKLHSYWSNGVRWNHSNTGVSIGGGAGTRSNSQAVWFRGSNGHLCNFWSDGTVYHSGDTGKIMDNAANCGLLSGTLVTTQDGLVRIDLIKKGNYVLSANSTTGATSYKKVTSIYKGKAMGTVTIKLSNGTSFSCSQSELLLTALGKWKFASKFKVNEQILALGNKFTVTGITLKNAPAVVYGITVADNHTLMIGSSQVIAHNGFLTNFATSLAGIPTSTAAVLAAATAYAFHTTPLNVGEEEYMRGFNDAVRMHDGGGSTTQTAAERDYANSFTEPSIP